MHAGDTAAGAGDAASADRGHGVDGLQLRERAPDDDGRRPRLGGRGVVVVVVAAGSVVVVIVCERRGHPGTSVAAANCSGNGVTGRSAGHGA